MPLKFLKNDKFFLIQNLQYYPKTSTLKKKKKIPILLYYPKTLSLSLSLSLYIDIFPPELIVIILFIYLWEIFPS